LEQRSFRLGCDIGGTFTDFVLVDDLTGQIHIHKCLTTPKDPSEAMEKGIVELLNSAPGYTSFLSEVIHGTTLVINAILERKGAKTGLITTKGFRDVLELGREIRYDAYDIFAEYPEPLVPRPMRMEVDERVASDGRILRPLDPNEVRGVLARLVEMGMESLAVCLINSFENPIHEKRIQEIALAEHPEIPVSISYEVLPQIREYERTSTTVTNAYVKPITGRYLGQLEERLRRLGIPGKLYIMLSSGGITSARVAMEFPVRIIESGPTAAVIASQFYGRMFGIENLFCFDMGGTTAKSCLIQKGEAGLVSTFEVGRVQRFKRGSGLPIQVPVVDLMEIGAGGGSIARVSRFGTLQVGPESAGADPGPVCYGLGGKEPTVTDADLILGYLNPDYFLGGAMPLFKEAASRAIEERVAAPLGVSMVQAAYGIHDLINEVMAAAAKTHIAEKGGNPRLVTVVAFGGAGPVHAYGLAKKIGAPRILVPKMPGVGSALGFFTAPMAFDVARSHKVNLMEADLEEIERIFQDLEAEASAAIGGKEVEKEVLYERSLDMRFVGQGAETHLPVERKPFHEFSREEIRRLFDRTYEHLYGRTYPDTPVEFVTFKVRARLPDRPFTIPPQPRGTKGLREAIKGERKAFSTKRKEFVPFTVYDRYRLPPGAVFSGPAIIEERESTTVVGEDGVVRVDDHGFLWIQLDQ
jgi:N-methylhydantoinase A/oxoprolinase/acetone carboxylase beta subunit